MCKTYSAKSLRRLRKTSWIRNLISENAVSSNDLILPIFVREGKNIIEPIKSEKGFWDYIEVLNNNKYFVGIIMILLNLGSKYISVELSQSQEKILGSPVIRRLIFSIKIVNLFLKRYDEPL